MGGRGSDRVLSHLPIGAVAQEAQGEGRQQDAHSDSRREFTLEKHTGIPQRTADGGHDQLETQPVPAFGAHPRVRLNGVT